MGKANLIEQSQASDSSMCPPILPSSDLIPHGLFFPFGFFKFFSDGPGMGFFFNHSLLPSGMSLLVETLQKWEIFYGSLVDRR